MHFCSVLYYLFTKLYFFVYKILLRYGALLEIGVGQGALTNAVDATTSLPLYIVVGLDGEGSLYLGSRQVFLTIVSKSYMR